MINLHRLFVARMFTSLFPFLLWLSFATWAMKLKTVSSKSDAVPALVIGGNFTLNGKSTNLAQYDQNSHTWYTRFEPQLYLYGMAAGEVNDLVVQPSTPYDNLYLVGSFDTVCKTCQQLYCSVGYWTGYDFEKVGDGLCPRATDVTMRILTAALTPANEFFVGGTFQSRVWSGEKFVNIYNVAQHDPINDVWLPLQGNSTGGGGLGCNWCTVSVMSLAWNEKYDMLYIGGKFNMIDGKYIDPGLAIWTKDAGIQAFPGGGLSYQAPIGQDIGMVYDGVATSLVYDEETLCLYVAGTFQLVNNQPCSSIAMWREDKQTWTCLYQEQHSFSLITSLLYTKQMLYVAGMPANGSSWYTSASSTYADKDPPIYMIARMSLTPALFYGKYNGWSKDTGSSSGSDENTSKRNMKETTSTSLRGNKRNVTNIEVITTEKSLAVETISTGTGGDDSYRFYWEWLPGFSGKSKKINKLAGGTGDFSNSIFIGGEFTPPILVWTDDSKWGAFTRTIGEEGDLVGTVTSIAQMQLAPPGSNSGDGNTPSTGDDPRVIDTGTVTIGIVVVCIILGICLGVGIALMCHNQRYLNLPLLKSIVEGRNGISLTTLASTSGSVVDMENEFKERFERAMQSRHLWNVHTLNVVNPSEIVLQKIIGTGSFGRVWSGMWRSSRVAVKEFVFAQTAIAGGSLQRNELIEEIVGEAAVMTLLRHPRILHLYGCSLTSQAIWIVSELCSRGSLRNVLDDKSLRLSVLQRLRIALEIAEGMLYLHTQDQPIIHRDLKSHNIFILETADGELLPKIGDWGSARALALHTGKLKTMTHGVGTASWLAPEVIIDAKSSAQSDVYAFGIILWELATRAEVYFGLSPAQVIARVANDGLRPSVPQHCLWRDLMVHCWRQDPLNRPQFSEVVQLLTKMLEKRTSRQSMSTRSNSRSTNRSFSSSSFSPVKPTINASSSEAKEISHDRSSDDESENDERKPFSLSPPQNTYTAHSPNSIVMHPADNHLPENRSMSPIQDTTESVKRKIRRLRTKKSRSKEEKESRRENH